MNLRSSGLAVALLLTSAVREGDEATLIYETKDRGTEAVGYDTEEDSAVELVRLYDSDATVIRRVGREGQPGGIIWKVDTEAGCQGLPCALGLAFSEKLGGYVVDVPVGRTNRQVGHIYFVPKGGRPTLVARGIRATRPDYPEDVDHVQHGVIGFERLLGTTVAEAGQILITGSREGDGRAIRTYVLEVGKNRPVQRLEGAILGRARDGFFVSQGTKGWKTLGKEELEEPAGELAQARLLPVTDSEVTKVVQSGDRRAELHGRDGELHIFPANGPAVRPAASGGQATSKPVSFTGCGSAPNRPFVTGVWASKRGTFMVAVDQNLTVEKQGRLVYGGQAHCLYEIP